MILFSFLGYYNYYPHLCSAKHVILITNREQRILLTINLRAFFMPFLFHTN